MRRTFLIHNISVFKGWKTCFRFLLATSGAFEIIFQAHSDAFDDDGLNAGKPEFLQIPSITISPYSGMENSIKVTGELNTTTRELFLSFIEPSFHGWKPNLWSFQLLKGSQAMLRIEDFTVGLLFLEESDIEELVAQGVNSADLQEIDSFSS